MKKIAVLMVLFASFALHAQQIKINDLKVITSDNSQHAHPEMDSSGNFVLFTSPNYKGLWAYKVKSEERIQITDKAGAGYNPVFDEASQTVYYRINDYKGFKKFSSLHAYKLSKEAHKTIKKASRFVTPPAIRNGRLVFQEKERLEHIVVDKAKASGSKLLDVRTEDKSIKLTNGETTKYLTPKGKGNYLWVSLSPDQSKILFTLAGKGTYVSDKSGTILREIGYLNAPVWLTNDYVLGMRDKDDGHRIVASDIFIVGINNDLEKNVTNTRDTIEMHPTANSGGTRIAYHTSEGNIEILNIEIRQ